MIDRSEHDQRIRDQCEQAQRDVEFSQLVRKCATSFVPDDKIEALLESTGKSRREFEAALRDAQRVMPSNS